MHDEELERTRRDAEALSEKREEMEGRAYDAAVKQLSALEGTLEEARQQQKLILGGDL
jgi:hypothetical protein